jgi:Alpha galactosidase A
MHLSPQVLLLLVMNMVCSSNSLFVSQSFVFVVLFWFLVQVDCWQLSRDAQGTIQPDPEKFPSGIPALVDYVHSRKLKFGIYSGIIIAFIYPFIDFNSHYFSVYIRCWIPNM